ncbi:hypothetical protein SAMN04488540_102310 [Ferrimonas sediminum]|uniref:Uncharacterized protein n=1 Tax=Ferrimonas sediminum TaxID=718193 RepID=A0A1G8M9N4_9GAMM|nr:hypothetical protein SAMN04488540_102310 [Ferrimonas sediminum]
MSRLQQKWLVISVGMGVVIASEGALMMMATL